MSAGPASVLQRILSETRAEVGRRKREAPIDALDRLAPLAHGPGRFQRALGAPGIGVIAEFKRRSPSAGELHAAPQLAQILSAYERGGAVAASVLTEGPNFGGALEDLRAAREACDLPVLRKDFIIDEYQLLEAQAAQADAVLLIVAALEDGELSRLHSRALGLGLDVLVEVHDRRELDRALALGAQVIGINNRDLRDFSVDIERTARLMEHVPSDVSVISESGIKHAAQLRDLRASGVEAVLVGESLMRSADPEAALRALISDGPRTPGML